MSTAGMIKVSAGCPTFDGTDYPYWKNKMRMHLEAIDNDLWYVVENGVPSVTPSLNATDVKRFKQLDSQAKNIICGHLSKGQYGRVSALETAKLIWDRLSKVNEGVSTQRDSRVDVLRNLFNRFKRLDNENVQQTFDRLTDISNELQALGATDITDHEVVKKLLRSLDSSFDTLALMGRKRRNPQNPHRQNPQGLHIIGRAAPRRPGHSLARKWTLRLNLKKMRKMSHLRSPNPEWRA